MADSYDWRNKSKRKDEENVFFRFYISTRTKGGKKDSYSAKFQRTIYYLHGQIQNGDPILIAYRGDNSIAKNVPHGNSKIKTNFLPSVPSVKNEIRQRCNETPSIDTLYNNLKSDQRAKRGLEHGQLMVRDPKQIANFRAKQKQSLIISPCQLTSLHLLSMYHLKDFIRFSNTIPEFYCVMALPEAVKLANHLLKNCETNRSLDQVITYDTTFDMGVFYLSTLVLKNTDLKNDFLLPVVFFLHNRKDTQTHKVLFDWTFNELDIPVSVPFVTDREHSIVNSILGHAVGPRQLFYCTNHILKNVRT